MIAQSISCDPLLLIADEPTTALDVTVQAEILDLLRNLHKRLDSAIILITHDMGVVADLADRIMVMKNGVVVESGTVDADLPRPAAPVHAAAARRRAAPRPRCARGGRRRATPSSRATARSFRRSPRSASAPPRRAEEIVETRAPVLSFEDVAIDYPKRGRVPAFRAAEHIDLRSTRARSSGSWASPGSGKTTLGRAAIGLLPIAEGKLDRRRRRHLEGVRRRTCSRSAARTGIVFQDPASSLNPRMPIGQSIGEPILLAGEAKGKDLDKRVETLLDARSSCRVRTATASRTSSPAVSVSASASRARSRSRPSCWSPTSPPRRSTSRCRRRFLELLQELQQQLQFACLFISHDLAVVDILAHRIAVMHHGKLVEIGTRDEILRGATDAVHAATHRRGAGARPRAAAGASRGARAAAVSRSARRS